jgi:outer membrane receptor protein involved in Fe transport
MTHQTRVAGVRPAAFRNLTVGLAVTGALLGSRAIAQDAAQDADELQEVVVTGSRLAASGFETPTPVTVLGADQLQDLAITNIGAGVNTLPAFRASTTPTTNGWGSFNVGAQIVNLRGLGTTRNLVLIDGRRFSPVTREGTADLNLIPSGLVERTEVVTGGASAAYGSDAIAGAVNVILDKDLTGIKLQADYGVSQEGDGDNYHFAIAGGSPFAGGRGHFIFGGEYDKQDGIGDCFSRDWCRGGVVITNPTSRPAGMPAFYRTDVGGGFFANTNGVIASLNNGPGAAPFYNLFGTGAVSFDASGNPVPHTIGTPAAGTLAASGDVVSSFTTAQLLVPVERYATFAHGSFDFNDDTRVFLEAAYGHVKGSTLQARYFGAPVPIFNDNPFVPDELRALMSGPPSATPSGTRPAAAAAVFNLSVLGQRRGASSSEADAYRVTAGIEGRLFGNWRWDGYYQYAHTDRTQIVLNNLVTGASRVINRPGSGGVSNPESYAYWSWATDAVYDPADAALPPGQRRIVCRATISPDPALRAAAAGCVPFNPFGEGRASTAALDYVYGDLVEDIGIDQHVIAANLQGELFDLWAGPLAVAVGAEFRHDSTELVHDDLSNVFAYFQNFGADYRARQDVVEGYLEAELPLLHDAPLAQNLSLNGALRRTRYDISGFGGFNQAPAENSIDLTSWKLGLLWDPLDWVRFRYTQSRDIRAPNFNELFQASASTFTSVTNRFVAGSPAQFPVLLTGGNPTLDAEVGRTSTIGMVLQPTWAWTQGLRLSLDYYRIKVDGYIATPGGAQNIVDLCYNNNDPLLCPLIVFGPNQSLAEVRNVNVNLQWLKVRGLDIEAVYRLPVPVLGGDLTLRALATRTFETSSNLFGVVTDRAGETGGLATQAAPDWLANLYTTWRGGPVTLTLSTRYISHGIFNALYTGPDDPAYNPALPNTINDNEVGGAVYWNLNGSYDLDWGGDRKVQLFAGVTNLFNKTPPAAPSLQYPTNPVYFDQIGRTYRAGVRLEF